MFKQLIKLSLGQLFAAEPAAAAEPEKPQFCKKDWNDQGVVTFTFGNGTVLECDSNKLSAELKLDLLCHGISQKVGDSYAGVKQNYGQGIANAKEVIDALYAGEWGPGREGGAPRLAELAEAISRIRGTDLEKTKAAVEKATDEERKAWRSNGKVKLAIAQIRAEKQQKAVEAMEPQELVINI